MICVMSSQRGWRYFSQGSHAGHPWPSLYQMCSFIECKCFVITKLATDSGFELSLAHRTFRRSSPCHYSWYRDHHVSQLLHAQLWRTAARGEGDSDDANDGRSKFFFAFNYKFLKAKITMLVEKLYSTGELADSGTVFVTHSVCLKFAH